MAKVPTARAKNLAWLVTPSLASTLASHSLSSLSLSFSTGAAFLSVVDIGLLTIEQTRVHLGHDHEHVHGGIHAQLVGHQPAQL